MLALDGLKVLDMAYQYPGPYCSMILADLGAEVLKVEVPGIGDPGRQWYSFFGGVNRNKKSLTLNLKSPQGKEILYKLVEEYDVFMEGFRPGVAGRLEVDYEKLKSIRSDIIYCSISGYGQDGPYRDLPGHDVNYQAIAGMLNCFDDGKGGVVLPQIAIGDLSSGMFAVIGILTSILVRNKSGIGQYIDVSMLDGLVSWMGNIIAMDSAGQETPVGGDAGYDIFKTKDGKRLALGIAYEDWFWQNLCRELDLQEYSNLNLKERTERKGEISKRLQEKFLLKDRDEWFQILSKANIPISPSLSVSEVSSDPQVLFRGMISEVKDTSGQVVTQAGVPFKLSETPGTIRTGAPLLGEHTDEILESLGYDKETIEMLKKEGAV